MKSNFQKVSLLLMNLLVLAHLHLNADTKPDVKGFDTGTVEYSFSRADMALDPGTWMRTADSGITLARQAWERLALTLYEDETERAAAAKRLDAWSREEIERRFTQWLERRFFPERAAGLSAAESTAVRKANLAYLYKTDDAGNILYDSATGDPLVIRPEDGGLDRLAADRVAWQNQVAQGREQALEQFRTLMASYTPELLGSVALEGRARFASQLEALGERLVNRKRKELEALASQEERLFVARRTGDVYSLRKKSESEAASAIVAQLIRETQSGLDQSFASLQTQIEAASAGTGDLALAGADWLAAYKEQFQRGLDAWQKAEERFMLRRIEWEQEAGKRYREGEEAWTKAFESLAKEQQIWESKAKSLFQAGEETFKRASDALERAIAEAKAEFQRDADLRSQAGADRARAWVDTYVTSGTMVVSARESSQYWIKKLADKNSQKTAPDIGDSALRVWTDSSLKTVWTEARDRYKQLESYRTDLRTLNEKEALRNRTKNEAKINYENAKKKEDDLQKEIDEYTYDDSSYISQADLDKLKAQLDQARSQRLYWEDWYINYDRKHVEAVAAYVAAKSSFDVTHALYYRLEAAISSIPENDAALNLARDARASLGASFDPDLIQAGVELKRWMAIYSEYSDRAREALNTLTKDFGLAIESGAGALVDVLDPAKTSEDFHLDEYQIELIRSQAVAAYWQKRVDIAQAVSRYAEDLTAGRTTDAESVAAWKAAKTAYDNALAAYTEAQAALTNAGTRVQQVREQVAQAAAELAKADRDLEELNQTYALRMSVYMVGSATYLKTELRSRYQDLLEQYGLLEKSGNDAPYVEYLEKAKRYGIAGTVEAAGLALKSLVQGDYGEEALSVLQERYTAIIVPKDNTHIPSRIDDFGLESSHPLYGSLKAAYERWQKAQGAEKEQLGSLLVDLAREAKGSAKSELEGRLDAISLLAATDWSFWYTSRGGTQEHTAIQNRGIGSVLAEDAEQAERRYLFERVELEEAVYTYLVDEQAPVSPTAQKVLLQSGLKGRVGAEAANRIRASLASLKTLLEQLAGVDKETYRKALEDRAAQDETSRRIIRGESLCATAEGIDLSAAALSISFERLARSRGRLAAYERYGSASAAEGRAQKEQFWISLQESFTAAGLSQSQQYGDLPNPAALAAKLLSDPEGTEAALARFLVSFDKAASLAPLWLAQDLSRWKEGLIQYVAAKARYSIKAGAPSSQDTLQASLQEELSSIKKLQEVQQELYGSAEGDMRALCLLLDIGAAQYGDLPRSILEAEVMRRISFSILAHLGDTSALSVEARRNALTSDAEASFSYASKTIREQAVSQALATLAMQDALRDRPDPAALSEGARTARLYQIFGELDTEGLAYFVSTTLKEAYIDELKPEEITRDTLPSLVDTVRQMRDASGAGSIYEERALALTLATALKDKEKHLEAVLQILDLSSQGGAEELINLVKKNDFSLNRELFAGQNPASSFYNIGAIYYLKGIILQETGGLYSAERDQLISRLKEAGYTSLAQSISAETDRFNRIVERSRAYGGNAVSGDRLSWALSQSALSIQDRIELATFLETGTMNDPYLTALDAVKEAASGFNPAGGSGALNQANTLFRQWMGSYLQDALAIRSAGISKLRARLSYAEALASQKAEEEAAKEEGRDHWRMYLEDGIFFDLSRTDNDKNIVWDAAGNPEGESGRVRSAAGWKEGSLADTWDEIELLQRNLGASLAAWEEQIADTLQDQSYRTKIEAYLADPAKAWDEASIDYAPTERQDQYSEALNRYQYTIQRKKSIQDTIARYGKEILAAKNTDALRAELDRLSSAITESHAAYQEKATAYRASAQNFSETGSMYEAAYTAAKDRYAKLEAARQSYEKEDAIRRWASTSYLGTEDSLGGTYRGPAAELAYSQERKRRADIAMAALKNLYSAATENRPYQDENYNALYKDYQESFSRMMLTLKVKDQVGQELAREYEKNRELYQAYYKSVFEGTGTNPAFTASPVQYDADYKPADDKSKREWKDVITIVNGQVRLAYTQDFTLKFVTTENVANLKDYFEKSDKLGTDLYESTAYERAMQDFAKRLSSYHFTQDKLITWGLARDYLMKQLIEKNKDMFPRIKDAYKMADTLRQNEGDFDVHYQKLKDRMDYYRAGVQPIYGWEYDEASQTDVYVITGYTDPGLPEAQEEAWNKLSAREREDMETLMTLALLGGGGSLTKILNSMTDYVEYKHMDSIVTYWKNWESGRRSNWFYGWWAKIEYDKLEKCQNHYAGAWNQRKTNMNASIQYINEQPQRIVSTLAAYKASNDRIAALEGKTEGTALTWSTLETALKASGKLSSSELSQMKGYWESSGLAADKTITNVSDALVRLSSWSRSKRDDEKRKLETAWTDDETDRQKAQMTYRETLSQYLEGKASEAELSRAAEAAYGKEAASRKEHLARLASAYEAGLETLTESSSRYQGEYAQLGQEYADLVGRVYKARLEAERLGREAEWETQKQDLADKRAAWREAAGLILERGRADWKAGLESLREGYTSWQKQFGEAYETGSLAWDSAYLEGLTEKEQWASSATKAAQEAATGAVLALVGLDAEAGGRAWDTQNPAMSLASGAEDAKAAAAEVLAMAGISRLSDALSVSMGSAGTAATAVRRGVNGMGLWDSAQAQVAAADFSRRANAELASRQARLVAAQARDTAKEILKGLEEQVKGANDNFRESMDETFIMQGSWQREGQNYRKDVVVYSTLLDPLVTERASVQGYIAYIMKPVNLKTDLSDSTLERLEANAIQALIGQVQNEVKEQSEVIFGTDTEKEDKAGRTIKVTVQTMKQVSNNLWEILRTWQFNREEVEKTTVEERTTGAGEFGRYIGYAPVTKANPNIEEGIDNLWVNSGTGELGRLMRSYIYWSMKESQGWAMVNKPVWDKPTWDDRGSWFKAPTIRGLADIAVTVGANALFPGAGGLLMNAALNLADDAVFAALDVGGGYKSWEEAGLEFGKKALTSTVNIGVGQLYSPVMTAVSASPGVGGVIGSTLVSGMQTVTTSTLNSAVNAFELTYDENGKITGLGWSQNSFNAGVQGGLISAATGMTSSLTSGLLNNWNAGEKLFGFSQMNQLDVYKFNQTIGSLACQGVNYALTGDFALNVLNLSDITGGALKGGLLELHLGKKGVTMNVGMGGADVSFGTIASAMGGLAVLDVNRQIGSYVKQSGKDNAVLLRTQYGFGDAVQKGQLWDILKGDTIIAEGGVDKENASAQTKREGDKRVVHLAGYREGMSKAEQLALGIVLAHEAYRNGIDDGEVGQRLETDRAVKGHITFAAALADTYGIGAIGSKLAAEVAAYTKAQTGDRSDLDAVLARYDASKDYWRLTKDGKLIFDKRATLTIENADGTTTEIGWEQLGVSSDKAVESALAKILKVNNATARQIMERDMGLKHSSEQNTEQWNWLKETKLPEKGWASYLRSLENQNYGKGMYVRDLEKSTQSNMLRDVFVATYRNELQGGIHDPTMISGLLSNTAKWSNEGSPSYDQFSVRMLEEFGNIFNGLSVSEQRGAISKTGSPTIAESFFNGIMSASEWEKYKAQGDTTYCSTFGYEKLVALDPRIAVSAFPNGFVRANEWQDALGKSPLFTLVTTMEDAASRASGNQLVIGTLKKDSGSGHIAFAVPSVTSFQSYNGAVNISGSGTLGYAGYVGNSPGYTIPVFAGVGSDKASGILPFGYIFGTDARGEKKDYPNIKYYRFGW